MHTKITLFALLLFLGCKSLETAPFDAYAFGRTKQVQKEVGQLLAKSTTAYNQNTAEIGEVIRKIAELKAYEATRKNNTISVTMWQRIDNENSGILPTLLKHWEAQNTLSETFRNNAQQQLDQAFEILLQWEQEKTNIRNP